MNFIPMYVKAKAKKGLNLILNKQRFIKAFCKKENIGSIKKIVLCLNKN